VPAKRPAHAERGAGQAACGTLSLNDLAWHDGLADCVPVSQLPGLGAATQAPPPLSNVVSLIRSPTAPPGRLPIILGAVGIIVLSLQAFFGGIVLLVGLDRDGSPLSGILLILLSIVGLIVLCPILQRPKSQSDRPLPGLRPIQTHHQRLAQPSHWSSDSDVPSLDRWAHVQGVRVANCLRVHPIDPRCWLVGNDLLLHHTSGVSQQRSVLRS